MIVRLTIPADHKTIIFLTLITKFFLFYFSGGVLTPAAAFAGTSLIDRLDEHGVKFSVVRCEIDSSM